MKNVVSFGDDSRLDAFRTPPHSKEAEAVVLASVMVNESAYDLIDFLNPEDFYFSDYQDIFRTIRGLKESGKSCTPPAVAEKAKTLIDNANEVIADLAVSSAVGPKNCREMANLVYDLARKRKLLEVSVELKESAYGTDEAARVQENIEKRLFEIGESVTEGPKHISHFMGKAMKDAEAAHKSGGVSGLPTGFLDLDAITGGLHATDLVILAGRPAMGKTALALNIAVHGAKNVPGAIFSLEMGGDQLSLREAAARAGTSTHKIRTGRMPDDRQIPLANAAEEISNLPIYIDDRSALSVQQIRSAARRLKRQHGIGFIVVDYLQLMRERAESKVVEISEISRGLKAIAKELRIPVLALSQLSRAVELREDKRPLLSDLRESGSIEQDADVVMFLYREEYYLKEPEKRESETETKFFERVESYQTTLAKCAGIAQVIIAKQRHGPTKTVELRFDANSTRFENLLRV